MSDKCVGSVKINCSQEHQLQFKSSSGGEEIICARSTLYDVGVNMLPKHSSMVVGDETSFSEEVALGPGAGGGEIVGLNPKS